MQNTFWRFTKLTVFTAGSGYWSMTSADSLLENFTMQNWETKIYDHGNLVSGLLCLFPYATEVNYWPLFSI